MRAAFLLCCLTCVGFSQTGDDTAKLLREVADLARTQVEVQGTLTYAGPKGEDRSTASFHFLTGPKGEVHFEQQGESPAVIACDDEEAWVYSPPLHRYRKETADRERVCSPIFGTWKDLPERLEQASLHGKCGSDPSGPVSDYILVTGYSEPELASVGRLARSLCIDPDRNVLVWERWTSQYSMRTYVYSKLTLNPEISSGAFQFEPPSDGTRTEFEIPIPRAPGERGMSTRPGTTVPRLLSKKNPKYPPSSRAARVEGTVVLYVVISSAGVPSDILVYRPVTPELDAEAIKSVQQWRFSPGTAGGQPANVPVMIEVNFKLK